MVMRIINKESSSKVSLSGQPVRSDNGSINKDGLVKFSSNIIIIEE